MAVRQQCLVPAKETSNLQRGCDTSIRWAAIPSIPMPERCSRELEGRKQQKCVAIRHSRLMMNTESNFELRIMNSVQNPAYRCAIFFLQTNNVFKDFNDLNDLNQNILQ